MSLLASDFQQRVATFQKNLSDDQAVVIAKPSHIQYFTGLPSLVPAEREAILYISAATVAVIGSSFLPTIVLPNTKILAGLSAMAIAKQVAALAKVDQVTTLQLDHQALFADEFAAIKDSVVDLSLKSTHLDETHIWRLRQIKTPAEIEIMRAAAKLSLTIFEQIKAEIVEGMTEKHIQKKLDIAMLEHDASPAFPTIVAIGDHSAAPHHQPTDRKLSAESPILIDWGCQFDNYCSDFTRTWWFGAQPDPTWTKVEKAVLAAYDEALAAAKVGSPLASIDLAARNSLKRDGYEKAFIHTTGHGLGLEIHEPPSLYHTNPGQVKQNMMITIEPGVYLPGQFGYRHENTILVGEADPIPLG